MHQFKKSWDMQKTQKFCKLLDFKNYKLIKAELSPHRLIGSAHQLGLPDRLTGSGHYEVIPPEFGHKPEVEK